MAGSYSGGCVAAALRLRGDAMTLKRTGQPDLTVYAKPYGASSATVVNSQARVTRTLLISNGEIAAASWPGPPRRADQLIDAAGKTHVVEHVDTRSDSGVVQNHRLTVTCSA